MFCHCVCLRNSLFCGAPQLPVGTWKKGRKYSYLCAKPDATCALPYALAGRNQDFLKTLAEYWQAHKMHEK
jgi:hypothetical protein